MTVYYYLVWTYTHNNTGRMATAASERTDVADDHLFSVVVAGEASPREPAAAVPRSSSGAGRSTVSAAAAVLPITSR